MRTEKELLSLQNTSESTTEQNNKNSSEATGIIPVDNTPFAVYRKNEENPWVIVCGNNMAAQEQFDTIESAIEYIKGEKGTQWDLMGTLFYTVAENVINNNKE